MTRLLLISLAITAVMAVFWWRVADYRATKITTLENKLTQCKQQKEACDDKVEKYNKAQQSAAEKIQQVRTVVRTVKADCDCYSARLPDDVKRLLNGK